MDKKQALDKSIAQWQMMADIPGMDKKQAYKILGGKCDQISCFLCDSLECYDCIKWYADTYAEYYFCTNAKSPYQKWIKDPSIENTLVMLEHLKDARKELA